MAHEELPPLNITPGAIRFNTDSMKLEYFRIGMEGGNSGSYAGIGTMAAGEWVQLTTDTPEIQTGGTRGVIAGGYTPGATDVIDYINIDTTGNAIDFGNQTTNFRSSGQCSSSTRGLIAGGITVPGGANRNNIEFITIASTGNATDSGDLTDARHNIGAFASSTRGCFAGGTNPSNVNIIDFVTIASLGDAVDFGDINSGSNQGMSGCSSATRGILGAGVNNITSINFVTISTQGNSATFGSLAVDTGSHSRGSCSNSIRGLFAGGSSNGNTIEYITIATLGNTQDFGDLTAGTRAGVSASASPTRGCFAGGMNPTPTSIIDYVQIMSIGNAVDFGDLTLARAYAYGSISNGHGGLG